MIVAIDGPAGSGKGTVTEAISKKFDLINIGSGSAYRAVALKTIKENIEINEVEKIVSLLDNLDIEFGMKDNKDIIYLDGEDVSQRIREKDVSSIVSQVSSIKEVRFKLTDIFRKCANGKDVIMEGRDIGSYVFPNAEVKIYLDASVEERAKRRFLQNQEKGIQMSFEEIVKNIEMRDKNDKEKEIGALKQTEDAIYIDTTNMSIDEVIEEISKIIEGRIRNWKVF